MYKILKIERYEQETFFTLLNLKTGEEIVCFEPYGENQLKSYNFIKEGEIYECLICMEAEIVDKKEYEYDNYYEILETNIRFGNWKFAKIKLGDNIYYISMSKIYNLEGWENKKILLLRQGQFHLLKVNNALNDAYSRDEEYEKKLPLLLQNAINNNNNLEIRLYTLALKMLED